MKQNSFLNLFPVPKPVVGMLHLGNLGNDSVLENAKRAQTLQKGGIDGILIENWQETSVGAFVSHDTARAIKEVVEKIRPYISIPIGINILNNDYKVALDIAREFDLHFVELDVLVDHVVSDFTFNATAKRHPFEISVDPREVFAYRDSIGANHIPIMCFVQPKHYRMLEDKPLKESVSQAKAVGAAGVVLTKATGISPEVTRLKEAKEAAGTMPVGVGSGMTKENIAQFSNADFFIVGSSLERDSIAGNPVSLARVKSFMNAVVKLR